MFHTTPTAMAVTALLYLFVPEVAAQTAEIPPETEHSLKLTSFSVGSQTFFAPVSPEEAEQNTEGSIPDETFVTLLNFFLEVPVEGTGTSE